MRFSAWLIDFLIIMTVVMLIESFMFGIIGALSWDLATAAAALTTFIAGIGYGVLLEWKWRGQTIGKRIFHIRVMDAQGLKLRFSRIVIRNLLRFIDQLPALYALGGITCFLNSKNQRLGDIAADTIVVWHPAIPEPELNHILPDKYNTLRKYPHLAARLRQQVSPHEAGIILDALIRRDRLNPKDRVRLFKSIAGRFQAMVEFPQEAVEGLSDEQYIRNVADIVFRTASL